MSDRVCIDTFKTGKEIHWRLMFNMLCVAEVDKHDLHHLGRKISEYLLDDTDEPLTIGAPGGSVEITRSAAHNLLQEIDSTAYRRW